MEEAGRSRDDDQRTRPPSRRPGRLRGRRGVCSLGGQGAADRGRVGVRGARRARRRFLRLGRRAVPERQAGGEHVARRVPLAEPQRRRVRGHLPYRELPAERLWALRHVRERLGMDDRLVHVEPCPVAVLRAGAAPGRPVSAQGDQGRAHISARPTIASATGRRRGKARRSTRRPATSAFAASSGRTSRNPCSPARAAAS